MRERKLIAESEVPRTRESLARDLRQLGVRPGMTLLLHSSLSSLGWVCGGAVAVIQAFLDVLTEAGTLVMPTHSGDCSDPAQWQRPAVPKEWLPELYAMMPAYDPALTPTRNMGQIPELFRTWPGVRRSAHPAKSFAAWGRYAEFVVEGHSFDNALGEESPLARIYDLEGWILLLGVSYDCNTSFYLAQYRIAGWPRVEMASPVRERGERIWKRYCDLSRAFTIPTSDGRTPLEELGWHFDQEGHTLRGRVGSAEAILLPQRACVDFTARWFEERRAEIGLTGHA